MLLRIFAAATAILSSAISVAAVNGPSSLYTLLNGMTFNPPGYTIVMYQSCVQNQNAGNPCGTFTNYQSSNGQYTYQLYGPEAPVSPSCSRTFHLTLACGPTIQMSGVNENPTCVYSATLSLPQVCGVDMTVGNEIASVSPTAAPPTTTSTPTGSNTSSPSATSTPLYQILYTPFPSTTSTQTITATTTPLFMITAWPTTSPVNVSATSTPLYYMTAYPSYNPNNASGGGLLSDIVSSVPSSTATILGGVAIGLVGLGAVGFAINHFRKGGSVAGLIGIAKENKANAMGLVNQLPISQDLKNKLEHPESLLPAEAQHAIEVAKQAAANPQSLVKLLPVSDSVKEQLNTIVPTSGEELLAQLQDPAALKARIQEQVQEQLQSQVQAALSQIQLQIPDVQQIVQAVVPTVVVAETETVPTVTVEDKSKQ